MSTLSILQARAVGYREVCVTYPALGDQLLLLYAAGIRYALTGEKTLVGSSAGELFDDQPYCDVVEGVSALTVSHMFKELNAADIKVIPMTYYRFQKMEDGRIRFLFPERHLLAEMCARLGISGSVSLVPSFELAETEKSFGRFFSDNQIAVMSQGKERRKSWGVDNMQAIINILKGRYNFVQIGAPDDPPLEGVLDKRGAFPLRNVASVLYNSDMFVGGIGALMHLARGVKCRSVITYSLSEPLYADSYPCNINLIPSVGCSLCQEDMLNAGNNDEACPGDFSCIRNIDRYEVCSAIDDMMKTRVDSPLAADITAITGAKPSPLNLLTARLFAAAQKERFKIKCVERVDTV